MSDASLFEVLLIFLSDDSTSDLHFVERTSGISKGKGVLQITRLESLVYFLS